MDAKAQVEAVHNPMLVYSLEEKINERMSCGQWMSRRLVGVVNTLIETLNQTIIASLNAAKLYKNIREMAERALVCEASACC